MNTQLIFLQKWLKNRSNKEKTYIFIGGFFIIYFFYYVIFVKPARLLKDDLTQRIATLQTQHDTVKQELISIQELSKSPVFLQMIASQKRLTQQIADMQQQLNNFTPNLISATDLPKFIKSILKANINDEMLISLEELPEEPWPPEKIAKESDLFKNFSGGFQQNFQMIIKSDYFNTIKYLQSLEKITKNVYWDHLNYKVVEYPKAEVTIKFHVLSLEKS